MFNNILFCIICLTISMISTMNLQATPLRIATYNLWNPIFEEKYSGQNTWKQRFPFLIKNILASDSDVISFEEVGQKQYLDLIEEINKQYLSIYLSHAASQPGQNEGRDGIALFYRPNKITLLNFVQSQDGSRPTHRRDFYADLRVAGNNNAPIHFRVACSHLDSGNDLSIGNQQLAALVEDVQKINKGENIDFVVVCGDFNEGENESFRPRFEIMQKAGFITDGSIARTRPEALDVRHNGHVDWIYFKKLSALNFELVPVMPIGDEKASDHKLTLTDLKF